MGKVAKLCMSVQACQRASSDALLEKETRSRKECLPDIQLQAQQGTANVPHRDVESQEGIDGEEVQGVPAFRGRGKSAMTNMSVEKRVIPCSLVWRQRLIVVVTLRHYEVSRERCCPHIVAHRSPHLLDH